MNITINVVSKDAPFPTSPPPPSKSLDPQVNLVVLSIFNEKQLFYFFLLFVRAQMARTALRMLRKYTMNFLSSKWLHFGEYSGE